LRPQFSDKVAVNEATAGPPGHDVVGRLTRAIEATSLAVAGALLVANIAHAFTAGLFLHWWSPLVVLVGALAADLMSGLVHWTADTWFSETMPVLGRRFLRPFRVHHVNPDDFLRRDVIDCNGDVAMLNIPLLSAALAMPDSVTGGAVALGLLAFSAVSLPTNQVHQWAHMPSPPRLVRWLQHRRVILSIEAHAQHHCEPFVANYCIATGWCNRWLTAIDFFPTCERLVTRLAGLHPRADEQSFANRWS
jgi:ubiquitin-conjugating enzyme E2 variant